MSEAVDRPVVRIPTTIWTLGFVSLFTDVGSEMVHALLPVLLAGGLGASALAIGLIEGAAAALVLVTKVFSGYISDALGRRKPLVLLGFVAVLLGVTSLASRVLDGTWNIIDPELRRR